MFSGRPRSRHHAHRANGQPYHQRCRVTREAAATIATAAA